MSNEKLKNVVLVVLAICLIGITVAYATLSQNLDISGVAKVGKTSWNIHFTKVLTPKAEGYAEGGKATLNSDSTVLTVSEGILKVPGDTITYVFDVINEGDLDAEVETVLTTIDSCKASDDTTDVTMYCDKIKYDLVYQDTKEAVKKNDQLLKGESKTLNLIITYDKNKELTSLPNTEIVLDNINSTINYTMIQKSSGSKDDSSSGSTGKIPTYESSKVIYFDPVKYELCDVTSTSDNCYAWFVLTSDKTSNSYEIVYKEDSYSGQDASNNNKTDLISYLDFITSSWSDKISKVGSGYNVSGVFDFTNSKARIMTYSELTENNNALYEKVRASLTTTAPTLLIGNETSFAGAMQQSLYTVGSMPPYSYFSQSGTLHINPVIKINLNNVSNATDYGEVRETGEVVYFNPEKNSYCSEEEYEDNLDGFNTTIISTAGIKSPTGLNTGCLKFNTLAFGDNAKKKTIDLLLDHNIMNGSIDQDDLTSTLNEYTKTWNSSLNVRAITAKEVALVAGYTSWKEGSSALQFYRGTKLDYTWLYNYTGGCNNYGCDVSDNTNGGYWTSSKGYCVSDDGVINNTRSVSGVRPVITVQKVIEPTTDPTPTEPDTPTELVCDENIYNNGTLTTDEYNEICKVNISTTGDVYSYSENSDGTISLTGFKGDVPSIYNNVLALPTTIDGKTVTQISGNLNRALSSKLVISPTIITIGEEAFKGNSFVALAMPNSVTSIGNYSFQQNNLSSLKIPSSVEVIGTSAFDSNNISDLTINEGLKTLYSQAFGNNALTSAKLPDSLTSLDPGVFYGTLVEKLDVGGGIPIKQGKFDSLKDSLKELTIGSDNVTTTQEQDQGAFSNYSKLQKVTVKSNVKKIGTSLFSYDKSLKSVKLSNNITEIGNYAFQGTSSLTYIKLPSSLESIGEKAFNESKLSSIAIPDSTISIGESAFKDAPLTIINLGNGLQKIFATAFYGSSSIDTLEVPDSVTFIGRGAFYNKKIKTLTIGDGISSIDSGMFISVTVNTLNIGKDSDKSQTIESYALNNSVLSVTYKVNIYGSVKNIEDQAFSYLGITSLTLNNGITKIGDGAFMSNNISRLTIPKSVTSIGSLAFYGNSNLSSVSDYSGVLTCNSIYNNSTIYNKVNNTTTKCSAN